MNEQSIFIEALERSPAERGAFVDRLCGNNPELRQRIHKLLAAHEATVSFMDQPAARLTEMRHDHALEACGSQIGPYTLQKLIGEGGMGSVYLAEQTEPVHRQVALKVIKAGMDSSLMIARFQGERQALTMMDHVNIARVLDAGSTESGQPYFVMEMVEGVAITTYCDEQQLTLRQRLELFLPVCQAIQHAHQKGMIHRDIKPSNVLVTLYEGRAVPKVIDFGVAKAVGPAHAEETLFTQYGTLVGTLDYMSPEQADFGVQGIDTRSDIYSLGVLLYLLLTGSTPLNHMHIKEQAYSEILRRIREQDPQKPSQRLSDSGELPFTAPRHRESVRLAKLIRGDLDWIVMKSLEKDRNLRYETASEFAADLQRYLNHEPVEAGPPSAWYRLRKFVRRNRGSVLAAGVLLLALLGGAVGTTLGMVQARQAEREAQSARDRIAQERDAAVAAQKETFDALIDLTDISSQYLLTDGRELEPMEREFLEGMAARYERLAVILSHDPDAQDMRAQSLSQMGQTYVHLGDFDRGVAAWRQAVELYRDWPSPDPADTAAARSASRANARRCRAIALTAEKLRRWPETTEFAQLQLRFAQASLASGEPPDVDLHNLLLTGHWSLTISLTESGRFAEALSSWEEMFQLVAWSGLGINESACKQLSRIATKLIEAGITADPSAVLALGLAERQAMLTADPKLAQPRFDLRQAYRAIGLFHEKRRRFQEALNAYDQALTLGEALSIRGGLLAEKEQELVFGAFIGRAVCLDALGQEADAETAWEALYRYTESKSERWLLIRLMQLVGNGQPERAVKMADATLLPPGNPQHYNAACIYAVASTDRGLSQDRKEQLARRAVMLLEEAKLSGAFNPHLVAHAKTDGDLDPLRGRDDFKTLMATLDLGQNPGQK